MNLSQEAARPEIRALIRRAIVIFPRRPYLSDSSVRHARRDWVAKFAALRAAGKLKVDQHVPRSAESIN